MHYEEQCKLFSRQIALRSQTKRHDEEGLCDSHKMYEKFREVFVKYSEGKIQVHIKQLNYE
jgi:hypothetical protein